MKNFLHKILNQSQQIALMGLLTFNVLASWSLYAANSHQINFNFALEEPDDGESRSQGSNILRFSVTSNTGWFRMVGGFNFLMGGGLQQGEFGIGPYIYPMGPISKSKIQPFFWAEGKIGYGQLDNKVRMDTGFGLGAGVDLKFTKKFGLTLGVEQHSATESATRLWFGLFWI